ncbi:CocE/NonD family hydrolase [Conexibacter woesei]|uniref:CocE/NonD family hydrolase n=1 Tax=Conexibacter woesei TaxID=191495 RepID=UPI000415834D|nr:CocE/NonD family hydrolase [Conexibacter woesei]
MRRAHVVLAALCLALLVPGVANATSYTLGSDGETAEAYNYHAAVRERVYIPQLGVDTDGNGVTDDVAIEIMRPAGSGPARQVPAIIDPSPYYASLCRGNEGQCIGDTDANGVNDRWPLFLDNYFVPRGYAVIYAEALGTANGTGCVMHGGPTDINAMKSVVDWLNGRVAGFTGPNSTGGAVTATWHDGSSAMIGKSYDGTLAEGVAATGVSGLKTIVPESAIDDWYGYSRMGGIRFNTHYPRTLSSAVTDAADRAACAGPWATLDADDGDATGDRNAFWDARDYLTNVSNVTASVLATHGLQDDNVRLDQLASWWAGLKLAGVPRKLWLLRAGHADPFDVRRAAWVDTLHKWFDHWLYGIPNDVMDQPRVDLENADESWSTLSDWPDPGVGRVDLHLRSGAASTDAGTVALTSGGTLDTLSWLDAPSQSETTMMNTPGGSQASRRVFLSAPLKRDLRISGTPLVDLKASLDQTQTNLGALLVDYGGTTPSTQVTRNGEGLSNTTTRTCWGQDDTAQTGDFSACYLEVTQPRTTVAPGAPWRVTKGILDSSNRTSLSGPALATIGVETEFPIILVPQDHVFAAGHQIGVILVGDDTGFPSIRGTGPATNITMNAKTTTVALPVVGGAAAAAASGGFDTTSPVFTVPGDQTLTAPAGATGAVATWTLPAATDDQDPSPVVACDPASGSAFPVGTTTVTCTATDASGNAASGTFAVVVDATPAPAPSQQQPPPPASDGGQQVGGVTTPVPAPGGVPATRPQAPAATATLDTVPVGLTRLTLSGRTHGRVVLRFTLSRAAVVTVSVKRHGARRATKTIRKSLARGARSVTVTGLRRGRYDVTITTRPQAGSGPARTVRKSVGVA